MRKQHRKNFSLLIIISFFVWSQFGHTVTPSDADPTKYVFDRVAEFLMGRVEETDPTTRLQPVMIVSSRLPSFQTRLSDIPANISYVPANVSYKGKKELAAAQARIFQDSIRDTEGAIFFDQVGNGVDTTFGLRGFGQGSQVIFIVDGVRINELDGDVINYPLLPMVNIETIQIDRGSASHVYGSGTFAGVVHITTRKPSDKPFTAFGNFEWSSFGGIRFNQGVSGTLQDKVTPLSGKLKYVFTMGRDLIDGFRDNSESRITSLDGKLEYESADATGKVHASVKHVDYAISNPGALTVDEFHADIEQTTNPLDGRDFLNTIIQFGADKKFWEEKIIASILAYWRVNLIHFYTTSRTFPDGIFNPDTDLTTTRSRSTDLIWQLAYRDAWEWFENEIHVGMELRNANQHDIEQDAFGGNVVELSPRETERSASPEYWSIFWSEQLKLFERAIAHFGMRHDWHSLQTDDQLTPTNNLSRRWRKSTFSAGITLKPSEFMDLFFNYSQGFRVPTISEIAPFSAGIATDLEPEETDSYEVGTRIRYEDLFLGKASFFVIDVKEEIRFDSTSVTATTPFGQNVNVGKSRRMGVEIRWDWIPMPEIDAYTSYTFMKAYIRESAGGGVPLDGRDLGLVPRHRWTMGATVLPFARLEDPLNGLEVSMNGVYTGEQFIQSFESTGQALLNAGGHIIDSYVVWNGMVAFNWRGRRIYLKINNIFDKKYYSRAVPATNFGSIITPAGTHLFVNPGAPREFLVGATWEIG